MLVLDAATVQRCIGMEEAIEASARAFVLSAEGRAVVPDRHVLALDRQGSVTLVMPGLVREDGLLGLKVGSLALGNPARGLPATMCTIAMFDPLTGRAEALIEATWLTALRTGAGVGAATRALARTDSVRAAMLGAGGMAFHMVEAMLVACPSLREVAIWNRTAERAERLLDALNHALGRRATFRRAADPAEAVAQADVVSVCTSSAEPVLRGAWLREGTHVNLAGAHGADMREGDDNLARRAAVVTADRRESALASGELGLALASGALRLDQVVDIGSVLSGAAPGRRSAADVTWFKSGGIAAQDLVTAQVVLRRAREMGLGQRVPFHAEPGGGAPGAG